MTTLSLATKLMKNIEKDIDTAIEQYIQNIIKHYGGKLEEKTLKNLWGEGVKNLATKPLRGSPTSSEIPLASLPATQPSRQISTTSVSNGEKCPYKYSKGQNAGTVCGVKLKNGNAFCAMHKKFEGKQPKERKILPEPKTAISLPLMLRQHKVLGKLWHTETGMVFKSAEEKIVIGKIENNKMVNLEEKDIELCRTWKFRVEGDAEPVPETDQGETKEVEPCNEPPQDKPKRGRKPKAAVEQKDVVLQEDQPKPKRGRKPKVQKEKEIEAQAEHEPEQQPPMSDEAPQVKPKRGRKPKVQKETAQTFPVTEFEVEKSTVKKALGLDQESEPEEVVEPAQEN